MNVLLGWGTLLLLGSGLIVWYYEIVSLQLAKIADTEGPNPFTEWPTDLEYKQTKTVWMGWLLVCIVGFWDSPQKPVSEAKAYSANLPLYLPRSTYMGVGINLQLSQKIDFAKGILTLKFKLSVFCAHFFIKSSYFQKKMQFWSFCLFILKWHAVLVTKNSSA